MVLEDMGANVTIAENGQRAIECASNKTYDLIYMDMQMPIISGSEAVKTLRSKGYSSPIVMLTANATLEDRNMCASAGCDEFITKPIEEEKLYKITSKYLKS